MVSPDIPVLYAFSPGKAVQGGTMRLPQVKMRPASSSYQAALLKTTPVTGNVALGQRLALYKAWKANAGIQCKPTLSQFRGFTAISGRAGAGAESAAKQFLGNNVRVITNEAGDAIFLSENGLRRIRFDFNRPYPHKNPHVNIEWKVGDEWYGSGPIYPKDVPAE